MNDVFVEAAMNESYLLAVRLLPASEDSEPAVGNDLIAFVSLIYLNKCIPFL